MSIKLWNWEKNWACQQVFEGHTHYVMQIVINPKDNNTFATASLDRTVKVCLTKLFCKTFLLKINSSSFRSGSWAPTHRISLLMDTRKEWIASTITMPATNLIWFQVQTIGLLKFGIIRIKPVSKLWKDMHRIFLLLLSTPNFQFCLLDLKMEQLGKLVIFFNFFLNQV